MEILVTPNLRFRIPQGMASQEGGKGPLFGDSGSSGDSGSFRFNPAWNKKKLEKIGESVSYEEINTTQCFFVIFFPKTPKKKNHLGHLRRQTKTYLSVPSDDCESCEAL